jgi:hypothetical protein
MGEHEHRDMERRLVAPPAVGFLCFVGACMLLAGRFAVEYRRGWAAASLVTGVAFLAAFVGIASGSSSPQVVIGFWAASLLAWTWLAAVSIDLYRRLGIPAGELA